MKHNWIGPKIKPRNSGLYIFTKSVEFNEYDKVIFRISADTRYRFYINGKYICMLIYNRYYTDTVRFKF